MSQTIASLVVVILATLLPKMGLEVGSAQLTTTISVLLTIGAALWAWIRRYQAGGIKWSGVRS